MLQGKKILLGVSGSIAAYKTPHLVRILVKAGAEVKVIATRASLEFVSPLSLSTVSKNPVLSELSEQDTWANHVALGRWADLMLIAPLSCNTLAKMSAGLCDNLLMSVYLSATCPVVVAPAMDEDMWKHPSTKQNLKKISDWGNQVIPVRHGELASGLVGEGRMAEPEEILDWVVRYFNGKEQWRNTHILITAGPTYEAVDPVRFIGNRSSGKMGIEIARAFASRGAKVTLVLGPTQLPAPESVETIRVETAKQMLAACLKVFPKVRIAVMSAAVADYAPARPARQKIKKSEEVLNIPLVKTTDILRQLGGMKNKSQLLVGFALETENEKANALKKLKEKNADVMVLNSLNDAGAGFGYDTNKITIFDRKGTEQHYPVQTKKEVAENIVEFVAGRIRLA
jgi:phosphopantothenoylcysteine decarboxylase/phosphopantothenate--cysteine ligase